MARTQQTAMSAVANGHQHYPDPCIDEEDYEEYDDEEEDDEEEVAAVEVEDKCHHFKQHVCNDHVTTKTSKGPESERSVPGKVGSAMSIKRSYLDPKPRGPRGNLPASWLDENPFHNSKSSVPGEELPAGETTTETLSHAIQLRYAAVSSLQGWKTKSQAAAKKMGLSAIVVRNRPLIDVLKKIVPDGLQAYNEWEEGLVFDEPFRPLFLAREGIRALAGGKIEIEEAATALKDEDPARHAEAQEAGKIFADIVMTELKESWSRIEEVLKDGEVTFELVWALFRKGVTVVCDIDNHPTAARVSQADLNHEMTSEYYKIVVEYLDWNGQSLNWTPHTIDIPEFKGRKKISEMQLFTMEHYAQKAEMMRKLADRGRKMVSIAADEIKTMSFRGNALELPGIFGGLLESNPRIADRVVIDATACQQHVRQHNVVGVPIAFKTKQQMVEALEDPDKEAMDSEIFIYCNARLRGYGLTSKMWLNLPVDGLSEVEWNDAAIESLVLPGDYKDLILSFTEAQTSGTKTFDDVIEGKGKGFLMLLAGPPGVGKTLTAEAVAEYMRRPLYSVSVSQLGTYGATAERALETPFALATRWNAVLLLDEADIFLQKRNDNDLYRNSIVAVFLRKLEYFEGTMFLTTNRMHSFDEAFRSRIHVVMRYPDLDRPARKKIWKNFITMATDNAEHPVFDEEELSSLSERSLNGREIKNIVKSALLLAKRGNEELSRKHIDTVWRIEHEDVALGWENCSDRV